MTAMLRLVRNQPRGFRVQFSHLRVKPEHFLPSRTTQHWAHFSEDFPVFIDSCQEIAGRAVRIRGRKGVGIVGHRGGGRHYGAPWHRGSPVSCIHWSRRLRNSLR